MKKTAIAAFLLTAMSAPLMAGTYNFEVDGSYDTAETGDIDTDTAALNGTFYFGGVDDSKGPLAEAAFLDKASSVTVGILSAEAENSVSNVKADTDLYTVGGEAVFTSMDWILGATYSTGDGEKTDIEGYSFTFGKYLTDNLSVKLNVSTVENDASNAADVDSDTYGIDMHYFFDSKTSDDGIKMAFDLGWNRTETDTKVVGMPTANSSVNVLSLAATLYTTDKLGFTFGWDASSSGDSSDTFSFSAEYFIIPAVAINAGVSHTSVVDENADSTRIASIGILGRF